MREQPDDIGAWARLVEAEYREMPGLKLTRPQVRRLWNLDEQRCNTLLETLLHAHVLEVGEHDAYVLADHP